MLYILYKNYFSFIGKKIPLTSDQKKTVSCRQRHYYLYRRRHRKYLLGSVQSEGKMARATSKESQHPLRKFSQLCVGIAEHGRKCEAAFLFYNA